MNSSNLIITVSKEIQRKFSRKTKNRVEVISNGFDPEDFNNIDGGSGYDKFTIAYSGKLNSQQNPLNFWKVLSEFVSNQEWDFKSKFELLFMGNFDSTIYETVKKYNLGRYLKDLGYVSHGNVLQHLSKAHCLLLVIPDVPDNKGIVTGKVFDYLALGKPILAFGPKDGDVDKIIKETSSGSLFSFSEDPGTFIKKQYQLYKEKVIETNKKSLQKYSRKDLTKKLSELMDSVLKDS